MLQPFVVRPRLPLVTLGLLACGAVALAGAPRLNVSLGPAAAEPVPAVAVQVASVPAPAVQAAPSANIAYTQISGDLVGDASPSSVASVAAQQAERTARDCGAGAYITGDMAGDASPASVLATMCGH
jgi:hypothetical protein